MKRITLVCMFLLAAAFLPSVASAAPSTHALVKTGKFTLSGIKKTLGVVTFAVENGVDVVHGALDVTSKALAAVNTVKILIPVQKVVAVADAGAAKVDTGLEAAEVYLFGSSN